MKKFVNAFVNNRLLRRLYLFSFVIIALPALITQTALPYTYYTFADISLLAEINFGLEPDFFYVLAIPALVYLVWNRKYKQLLASPFILLLLALIFDSNPHAIVYHDASSELAGTRQYNLALEEFVGSRRLDSSEQNQFASQILSNRDSVEWIDDREKARVKTHAVEYIWDGREENVNVSSKHKRYFDRVESAKNEQSFSDSLSQRLKSGLQYFEWESTELEKFQIRTSISTESIIAFFIFVLFGRMLSFEFILLIGYVFFRGFPDSNIDLYCWGWFKLISVSILTKVCFCAVAHNAKYLLSCGVWGLIKNIFRSLWLFTIILVPLMTWNLYINYLERETISKMYKEQWNSEISASVGPQLRPEYKHNRAFRYDTIASSEYNLRTLQTKLHNDVLDSVREVKRTSLEGVEQTRRAEKVFNDSIERIIKPTLPKVNIAFTPPRCNKWYHWLTKTGNCVEKSIKEPINATYADQRDGLVNSMQSRVTRELQYTVSSMNGDLEQGANAMLEELDKSFVVAQEKANEAIWSSFFAKDVYTFIGTFFFWIILIKSYMYIFARVHLVRMHQKNHESYVSLSGGIDKSKSRVEFFEKELKLTPSYGETFYSNKAVSFKNTTPKEKTPQPFKGFITRWASSTWNLNRFSVIPENEGDIPFCRISDDERIIGVKLVHGDQIIVPWNDFVAMDASIRIKTFYTWSLLALILGRHLYSTAHVRNRENEKGWIFLRAYGPITSDPDAPTESDEPSQLLAFQTETRFKLRSEMTFRDIYRSSVQVQPHRDDFAIFHLNKRKQFASGAAKFIKNFLIPI